MEFLTNEQLLAHLRADSDSAEQLSVYGDAAEDMAAAYLNRTIFTDADSLAAAVTNARQALTDAGTAYHTAMASLSATDIEEMSDDYLLAKQTYDAARVAAWKDLHGIVINPSLIAAMLLIATHLWTNRSDVVTGQYGIAVQVPQNSQWIMDRWRYLEGTI